MTKGIVRLINPRVGFIAIETDGNDFTIVEVTSDDEFEIGDVVQWEQALGLGFDTYYNLTQRKKVDLIAQNHAVRPDALRELMIF